MEFKIGDKVRFEFGDHQTRVGKIKKVKGLLFKKYLITVNYPKNIFTGDVCFYWIPSKEIIEKVDANYVGCY